MHSVSDLFIRRPVFTIVINLLLALVGILGLTRLTIRDLPAFDLPYVSVSTVYPGAAPDLIERTVTTPIEQAIAAIGGIDTVVSTSTQGMSAIQVGFKVGTNSLDAVNQVRDKVGALRNILPKDVLSPTVAQLSLDSVPIIYLSLTSSQLTPMELTEVVSRVMRPALSSVDGVAAVQTLGERRYAIRIWLKPEALAGHNVTASDVNDAILAQNIAVPSGTLEQAGRRALVVANTSLTRPEQFRDIVVRRGSDNNEVKLDDVATVEVGPESEDNSVALNNSNGVAVGVLPQSSANPLDVAREVRALLPTLQGLVPQGVDVSVAFDRSTVIEISVSEVKDTILIAVALVIGVILLFLASLRSSFVTVVTIPLSLIGMLGFMFVMGYSLNTFTLLAMVLAVGLVVDDAIVDVENVQRHIDEGRDPMTAAFIGSREIGFAIVATTLTLASVYLPIGLVPGLLGNLFREFAFTLAAGVVLSGFISRTLSPMMCSRILRAKRPGGVAVRIDRFFDALARGYGHVLSGALRMRWLVILVSALAFVGGLKVAGTLRGEFAPVDDPGYVFVKFAAPTDATNGYMRLLTSVIGKQFATVPEARGSMILNGLSAPNEGYGFLLLKPWADRHATAQQIGDRILPELQKIPGARFNIIDPNPLAGGSAPPVQFVLKSTGTYEELAATAGKLQDWARTYPGLVEPSLDLDLNTRKVEIGIDRPLAANLGLDIARIGQTLNAFLGGQQAGFFGWNGEQYKVLLQVDNRDRRNADVVNNIYIRGANNQVAPLSLVVRPKETVGASSLPHFQQLRAATISGSVANGYSLSQVLDAMEAQAKLIMPPGTQVDFNGPSRSLKQANAAVGLIFVLAIVFIYLVLSAQFESFRDPVIVLVVVPVSMTGALLGLVVNDGSLNAYSFIGIITLIGLVAKNGILITEFANQLRDDGRELRDAVIHSAMVRLRPILMTTTATVLGAVPLLITVGPGARSRGDLGAVVVGGMLLGTLVSLFLVPACYTLISRKQRKHLVEIPGAAPMPVAAE